MKQLFVVVIAVLTGAEIGVAQESALRAELSNTLLRSPRGDYELIIDALCSNNPEPAIVPTRFGGKRPAFAENYDSQEQQLRIRGLLEQLWAGIEEAWPVAVAHLDDERYCLTCTWEDIPYNFTVGDICRLVLRENIPWPAAKFAPNYYAWRFLRSPPAMPEENAMLQDWCIAEIKAGKGLCDLQIDACKWAMGFIPAIKDVMNVEEKQAAITGIAKMMRDLQSTKKAVTRESFFLRDIRGMSSPRLGSADERRRFEQGGELPK